MESREVQSQATAGRGLQQQQQQPPPMTIGATSSSYSSNTNLINSNPTANIPPQTHRFAFNHLTSPSPPPPPSHNQHQLQQYHHPQNQNHQQNHQNQHQLKPLDSLNNSLGFDGSPPQFQYSTEPANLKKKRGRPRKYAPDGNIALQLAPATPLNTHSNANHGGGGNESVGLGSGGGSSEAPAKRSRGRPPGSGKRQIDALGGVSGVGFTPHVITVNTGEDISSKIMAFSTQGPRTVCILSANGAVSDVTLRQPVASTVKYEGQYEIISLSGSLSVSENNGSCSSRSGGLNVSLAGSDGRVIGGGVVGTLQAASPVQIVVGSFISDGGRKQNVDVFSTGPAYIPALNTQNFGAPGTAGSSPSQGGSSESSEENGGSPLNGGSGFYTNSAPPPSIHNNNMQMNSLWPGHNQQ